MRMELGCHPDVKQAFNCVPESFSFLHCEGVSTKHIRTAADLVRFGASLKVDCLCCGSSRTLSGTEAAQSLGTGPLSVAWSRMKCSRCDAKDARLTILPPL